MLVTTRLTTLSALLASCGADPTPSASVGDGIYLVDRTGGDPVRLAGVAGDSSAIKFGVYEHGNSLDLAYVQDDDRNLFTLQAMLDGGQVSVTPPQARLVRSDQWSLNGPAYCQARAELAVGIWSASAIDVDVIAVDTLQAMAPSSVEQAIAREELKAVQTADAQISTDLTCGNLSSGVAYNFLDCTNKSSVDACLSSPGTSRIDYKPSRTAPAQRLTFPETDSDIIGSTATALVGDNGPAVYVADDASMHVMFERDYSNATSIADPEFQPFGFNKLMYKHIVDEASTATEYELDFSHWLPRPASREIVNSSSVRVDASTVDFLALGVFKTPSASGPYDDTVYMGIVAGEFDDDVLPADTHIIVLDGARVQPVISFDRFTCYAWRTYGMAPDGNEIDMYALAYPQFVGDRVAFSATKYRLAALVNGMAVYGDGSTETEAHLNARMCGS